MGSGAASVPAVTALRLPSAATAGSATRQAVEALDRWLAGDGEVPLMIETSGSSGDPKRVLLSRAAVLASAAASADRLGDTGPWALALPPAYIAGVQVVVRSLVAGHPPVQVGDAGFADAVARGARFTSLVPTQLHRLLARPREREALAALHTVLVGGGPVDPGLRADAETAGVHVVATYGASETAGGCVYDGLPLEGVAVDVLADGRIRIGGPTLFTAYQGDEALTRATLVDGWFLTSDSGSIDDGRLTVLGRLDDMVISGGVKVPAPVVAARLRQHPAIAAAEVLGVPDEEWGQRVVAFVVGEADPAELRDWVAEVHPREWTPRRVVRLGALPLLDNGKVDRAALRRRG